MSGGSPAAEPPCASGLGCGVALVSDQLPALRPFLETKIERRQALIGEPVPGVAQAVYTGPGAADHRAGIVWASAEGLHVTPFYQQIQRVEGEAGRTVTGPKLLLNPWLYAPAQKAKDPARDTPLALPTTSPRSPFGGSRWGRTRPGPSPRGGRPPPRV